MRLFKSKNEPSRLAKKMDWLRAEPNFDFMKHRRIFFLIPVVLLAVTVVFGFILGMSLDVKFKGGTIIEVPTAGDVDLNQARDVAQTQLGGECIVQLGESSNGKQLVITLSESEDVSPEQVSSLLNELKTTFPDSIKANESEVSTTTVDPQVGMDFFQKCLVAVAFAFLAIVVYIGIRFRKIGGVSAGLVGILTLLHDVGFVFAAMVFFRFTINDAFMAIVLTILGYSINNTIVVYDRVRENRAVLEKEKPIAEIVNLSINQTLSRSINTTLTTVLALIVMLIVGLIWHLDTIVAFVLPLIFGMAAGLYSSVFISGPLWVLWKQKHPDKPEKKRKTNKSKGQLQDQQDEEIEVRTRFKINPKAMTSMQGDNTKQQGHDIQAELVEKEPMEEEGVVSLENSGEVRMGVIPNPAQASQAEDESESMAKKIWKKQKKTPPEKN